VPLIEKEQEHSLWGVEEIFAEGSALHEQAKGMPCYHPLAWDLVRRLLVISPQSRLTALQAYVHPFFQVLYDVLSPSLVYLHSL